MILVTALGTVRLPKFHKTLSTTFHDVILRLAWLQRLNLLHRLSLADEHRVLSPSDRSARPGLLVVARRVPHGDIYRAGSSIVVVGSSAILANR